MRFIARILLLVSFAATLAYSQTLPHFNTSSFCFRKTAPRTTCSEAIPPLSPESTYNNRNSGSRGALVPVSILATIIPHGRRFGRRGADKVPCATPASPSAATPSAAA
jgi:hypothetical protein